MSTYSARKFFIIIVIICVLITTAAILLYNQQVVLLQKMALMSDNLKKHDNSIAELFHRSKPVEKYYDPKPFEYEIKNNQIFLKKERKVVLDDLAQKTGENITINYSTVIAEPTWRPYIYFTLNESAHVFQYDLDNKKLQKMSWTIDLERFNQRTPALSPEHSMYIVANRLEKNNPNEEIRSLIVTNFIKGTQEVTTPLKSPLTYRAYSDQKGGIGDNLGVRGKYGQQFSYIIEVYFDTAPLNILPLRNPIYENIWYFE